MNRAVEILATLAVACGLWAVSASAQLQTIKQPLLCETNVTVEGSLSVTGDVTIAGTLNSEDIGSFDNPYFTGNIYLDTNDTDTAIYFGSGEDYLRVSAEGEWTFWLGTVGYAALQLSDSPGRVYVNPLQDDIDFAVSTETADPIYVYGSNGHIDFNYGGDDIDIWFYDESYDMNLFLEGTGRTGIGTYEPDAGFHCTRGAHFGNVVTNDGNTFINANCYVTGDLIRGAGSGSPTNYVGFLTNTAAIPAASTATANPWTMVLTTTQAYFCATADWVGTGTNWVRWAVTNQW